ncbi:DUF2306 domain-containing protein [Streptomyces sp. NPDC002577]
MTTSTLAAPPASTDRRAGWLLMTVPALLIASYSLYFMVGTPPGDPAVKQRLLSNPTGYFHIYGSLIAMAIGPFQLRSSLRVRNPRVHVWLGRVYLIAILCGGLASIYVAKNSIAYTLGDIGFAALGSFWVGTAFLTYGAIRKGNVEAHRRWAIYNYAMTYAAVTLRFQLPTMIALGMGSSFALTITGWSSWVPNLLFAAWWIRRSEKARPAPRPW